MTSVNDETQDETVLDLSSRNFPSIHGHKQAFVPSPTLMPPPKLLPNLDSCPPLKNPKKFYKPKIFTAQTSTKLSVDKKSAMAGVSTNNCYNAKPKLSVDKKSAMAAVSTNNCYIRKPNRVPVVKRVKSSVPEYDVNCYVTNNTETDYYTKQLVCQQIASKIYKRPNTRLTPEKLAEQNPTDVKDSVKSHIAPGLKVDTEHFKKKNMKIEDIDIDSLNAPIRSSTPTPSINDASTIIAGNLDVSLLEDDATLASPFISSETIASDDVLETILKDLKVPQSKQRMTRQIKEEEKKEDLSKTNSYCNEWVKKERGVSTTNTDVAPSIYDTTVALSDSLLDLTSISRNVPPPKNEIGRANAKEQIKGYNNTVFM